MSEKALGPEDYDPELVERKRVRERYLENILRVWTHKPDVCPICGSDAWNVPDLVEVHVRNLTVEARVIGNVGAYVYIPCTCTLCGYTIFFHTGILDARDKDKAIGPIYAEGSENVPPSGSAD